jgi:pyruvate,water dikinase
VPSECKGWEELYPPHTLFADDRRGFEQSRFWFQDAVHYAEPYHPFDAMLAYCIVINFNQTSARRFVVPTSLGVEQRILGGYVYLSPNSITDEETIAARAELFAMRGGYYYEHWDEFDRQWRKKVQAEIRELEALEVPELPEVEDEALVTKGAGVASSHRLLTAYERLLESFDRICGFHFELMNLGYGAYLAFYELCKESFPDIPEIMIAKMVAGIDVVTLRPDDELKRLAVRAVELGVGAQVRSAHDESDLTAAVAISAAGERWLAEYRKAKDPWFCFSYGNGMYHHHRSWIDDPALPIAMIGSYIARVQAGEDIRRPQNAVLAERDRVTGEYRTLLPARARDIFDSQLALTRTVFPQSRTTTSTSITGPTRCYGTRCGSSVRSCPVTASSPTPRTRSSCATTRSARHLKSYACTGAPAGPASPGAPRTGPRSSNAARRSTTNCVAGPRLPLWAWRRRP